MYDAATNNYDLERLSQLQRTSLEEIIKTREKYVRKTEGSGQQKLKRQIKYSLNSIALHFVVKVLFIKIIEDISDTAGLPKVLKRLFPRPEFEYIGGIFAYRVLDKLSEKQKFVILRNLKRAFRDLNKLLANLTWEDIFRYGFKIHANRFGELITAKHYDSFYPSNEVLEAIRNELIKIDLGYILSNGTTRNFVGELYMKLIDDSLKDVFGTVYTPDDTVDFMVRLSKVELGNFMGKKILEPACGSGHFVKRLYREYVDEVKEVQNLAGQSPDLIEAHKEALNHIFGRDIDPFAAQLTLLAIFLEEMRDNITVEDMIGNDIHWLPDKSIDCVDSIDPDTFTGQVALDFVRTTQLNGGRGRHVTQSHARTTNPDLIIGNPPYGIKVTNEIKTLYQLGSRDSYGVFIDNSIRRLPDRGYLVFIISSSFLTLGTHETLRRRIFDRCKIKRIFKLHRSTFPGIDVFPVILELQKCDNEDERDQNIYHFYDLWQLHPVRDRDLLIAVYDAVLSDLSAASPWLFDRKISARYLVRQGFIKELREQRPIFDANTKIFSLLDNRSADNRCTIEIDGREFDARSIEMPLDNVIVVRLGVVTDIKQGLITGDNEKYIRRDHRITLGEGQREYGDINLGNILSIETAANLTGVEKSDGIVINNPEEDHYFIPYDKGGSSDISEKLLNNYWSEDGFYIDWSRSSVQEMKTSRSARFQNSQYYFREGVTYSTTGIYSPTFRLGSSTVFDAKGSTVFSDVFSREFLLGVLCSKLARYILKSYIQHTVDMHEGPLSEFPLAISSSDKRTSVEDLVKQIIANKKRNNDYDYREEQERLDELIYIVYGLNDELINEVNNWYDRKYPKLRRDIEYEE